VTAEPASGSVIAIEIRRSPERNGAKVPLLLVVRAEPGELLDRAEVEHLERVAAGSGDLRDRLDREHRVEQRAALAAVLDREVDPREPVAAERPQIGLRQHAGGAEAVAGELARRELAGGLDEAALLVRELEVHQACSSAAMPAWWSIIAFSARAVRSGIGKTGTRASR
jgi:hypothetical protein